MAELTGWRRMLDLSLPNFYGGLGVFIVVAVALKAWSLAQGGYSLAISHFGLAWTIAGIVGVILILLSFAIMMKRGRRDSADITSEPPASIPTPNFIAEPHPELLFKNGRMFRDPVGYFFQGEFRNIGQVEAKGVRIDFPEMPRWRTSPLGVGKDWPVLGPCNHPQIDADTKIKPAAIEYSDGHQVYRQETFVEMPPRPGSNMRGYEVKPLGKPFKIDDYSIPD